MKRALMFFLIAVLITTFSGCQRMITDLFTFSREEDPETQVINDQYELDYLFYLPNMSKEVALYKENDGILFVKNFIAYDVQNNILLLCEDKKDSTYVYWPFDLDTEETDDPESVNADSYSEVSDMLKTLGLSEVAWEKLWVEEINIPSR